MLNETLGSYDNVTVINEDILKLDLGALADEYNDGKPIKVVANLPYYITTPIIMGLFESHVPVDNVRSWSRRKWQSAWRPGREVRIYGALSVAVQYYAKPYIVANVPRNCFMPRPNVDSAVIRLTCHEKPRWKPRMSI